MLNAEKKKGVVIKYKNGDKCENDPSKTYETIYPIASRCGVFTRY